MPTYLFWGEDDFAIGRAAKKLQETVLDSTWLPFNYHKIAGDAADATRQALQQSLTPPFGLGERLVWLVEGTLCQQCSQDLLSELERTLPAIPPNCHFLITSSKKPDGRLKSTKLLQKYAEMREYSLIPPWKAAEIASKVAEMAQELGVRLTPAACQLLAEAVGNNTRQLWGELEKLRLYGQGQDKPLDGEAIAALVNASTQNSLQLAAAIREGNGAKALRLVADLMARNEPPLRIVATLTGQFRTWTTVKLQIEKGERDEKVIATAAEIANPKRIYFLRKEVQSLMASQLLAALPLLLDLEFKLKRGREPMSTLQAAVIELCQLFISNK